MMQTCNIRDLRTGDLVFAIDPCFFRNASNTRTIYRLGSCEGFFVVSGYDCGIVSILVSSGIIKIDAYQNLDYSMNFCRMS